jgi:Cu/Ag efflux pump CusA
VSENNKIIIFLALIPVVAVMIILTSAMAKFAPSFSPVEQKVFNFAYERVPDISERQALSVSSIRNPVNLRRGGEQVFPKTALAEIVPPPETAEKRVSFILVDQKKRLAIIDGKFVHEGDVIDNHKIAKIEKDKVLLKGKEGEKWLKMD